MMQVAITTNINGAIAIAPYGIHNFLQKTDLFPCQVKMQAVDLLFGTSNLFEAGTPL